LGADLVVECSNFVAASAASPKFNENIINDLTYILYFNVRGELYMQYIVFDTDSCSVC